ncbi:Cell division control protein [Lasiodiplodia theobromae]|uniref:Cell division control protein 15 n=1 Tax=Lasiodiplodia theobromae TaxID=45133 RepID=A0A5N5DH69_9PEZI|nr:Cell division control protein [Lasiodiplodia theobromae]KAB2577057.1 Cell division control protein 15 [Lasiodiplodia theobromae]KAF4543803.1 Cell division control protein [Lasiodiplodia theobromae]
MPGTTVSDPPSVSLSFANNFWGKDDAGVTPLLERMHNAKVTGDELKSFYTARAHIEEEYARKLLNLSRKPLGSSEAGTLKMSLDVVRAEVEAMGKQHQQIAGQMKSELEEQLSAFTGGLKERRKIVQTGIEKLLKVKMQQTAAVNKARDRYEQDSLKIKGYLAQGHMVMGHEERKNKAKLEKTQIQLSGSSQEYEQAVKILEETTARWNREWKKACDSFQDLEEERIDFMKSSLWAFANIASTVCVSDDASLEKIRLSLEDCEVEKDITTFIRESGTGQEIPDPPKFIDFCRGDASDDASMTSEDNNYTVAQFARTMNPAFRSASPQPSLYESHHDPNNPLARELAHKDGNAPASSPIDPPLSARSDPRAVAQAMQEQYQSQYGDIPQVPHNAYPTDGMTQFCRIAPHSERSSSIASPARPDSRDSRSDLSAPTSFTSADPASLPASPIKQADDPVAETTPIAPRERAVLKKKSGFFQGHSPFKRKSRGEESGSPATPTGRNTWSAAGAREGSRPPYGRQARTPILGSNDVVSASPEPDAEPVDPRANFQLNVGKNVFDVASPDKKKQESANGAAEEQDPIAAALAELKAPSKQTSVRMTADRYAGLATPAPSVAAGNVSDPVKNASRGAPPPSYEQPMSRLGAPQPAHTAKQMQQTTQSYVKQTQSMFNPRASGGSSRPSTRGSQDIRATSPAPGPRATSPRPGLNNRATSPNPYAAPAGGSRPRAQSTSPVKPREWGSWNSRGGSPANVPRAVSPQPQFSRPGTRTGATSPAPHFGGAGQRPGSSAGGAMVLAPASGEGGGGYGGGSQRTGRSSTRPMSYYGGGSGGGSEFGGGQGQVGRVRSRSVAADARYTSTGCPIMHYSRAMYMYQAQIPEELSFNKGDVLAITREQDDGWWEAEVLSKPGRLGLVPSNYLQNC